jgi:hypothetical protein
MVYDAGHEGAASANGLLFADDCQAARGGTGPGKRRSERGSPMRVCLHRSVTPWRSGVDPVTHTRFGWQGPDPVNGMLRQAGEFVIPSQDK